MNKINPIIWNYFDGWMCFHHWRIIWMKIIVINETCIEGMKFNVWNSNVMGWIVMNANDPFIQHV